MPDTKRLVIAEKPSVAADIARALGGCPRKGDHFEGDEVIVTSAIGHLVELYMPEDMDKRFSFWKLNDLPILPDKFQLKPIEKTADRFKEVVKLMKRKDVGQVINACDAGREGELIFNYLHELSGINKPVMRLWMSSMTAAGIREAFSHLRTAEQMRPLGDAARSRSEADWLIGINATRAITKRLYGSRRGMMATIGRVQTPTLAILMNREREIRDFKPRGYFRISADFDVTSGGYEGIYQKPDYRKSDDEHDKADRIWDRAVAERVLAEVKAAGRASVTDESKRTTQAPPRLFDLTSLQREANNKFGYPARRTLQIAQALYEKHKMITYPRTDSRALPEDYIPLVKETLSGLGEHQAHVAPVLANGWVRPNKRIFNNAEVTDHFAIIPTNQASKALDDSEQRIYDLIVRRFIAIFHPSAQFDVTTRTSLVAGHAFKSEGKVLVEPGWLSVYGRTTLGDDERSLPALVAADGSPASAGLAEAVLLEEATRPPPRYTEATLLSAMEGAGKFVDDEDLADAMSERGLGTPATRASIIEHLISEKYVSREQRELVPTTKAETVLEFLNSVKCEALTSPALTGEWEFKLRKVEHGQLPRDEFMSGIRELTKSIVENTKNYSESAETAKKLDWSAFTDGQPMLEFDRKLQSQDGKIEIYKVIGGRRFTEEELRELVDKRQVGPIDSFVSAKSGKKYSALLQLLEDDKGVWKAKFVFENSGGLGGGQPIDLKELEPIGTYEKTGERIYATPQNYVVQSFADGEEKQVHRLPRNLLGQDIPLEQYLKYLNEGRTDVMEKFFSRRTKRPFKAALVRKADGSGFDFDFPPRAPKDPSARKGAKGRRKTASKAETGTEDAP
jgi:DNA topoisomerase III